jgi:CBS domain-containing protein
MTPEPRALLPDESVSRAAALMRDADVGMIPIVSGLKNRELVGVITDRDIAVRAVALGKGPQTPVREVMSPEVMYCFEDDDTDAVARNMADIKVRRLPVVNRDKRLVGIIALGDLAVGKYTPPAGAVSGSRGRAGTPDRRPVTEAPGRNAGRENSWRGPGELTAGAQPTGPRSRSQFLLSIFPNAGPPTAGQGIVLLPTAAAAG